MKHKEGKRSWPELTKAAEDCLLEATTLLNSYRAGPISAAAVVMNSVAALAFEVAALRKVLEKDRSPSEE
jgi:hypothetical protein